VKLYRLPYVLTYLRKSKQYFHACQEIRKK
jgi:hypothetical protein